MHAQRREVTRLIAGVSLDTTKQMGVCVVAIDNVSSAVLCSSSDGNFSGEPVRNAGML
jgi:hypothetical protein